MSSGIGGTGGGIGVSGSRPANSSPLRPGGLPRLGRPNVTRQHTKDDFSAHSLLGNLEGGDASGMSTEFEVDVPLPGCQVVRTPIDSRTKNSPLIPVRFHHGTIWENIVVHHWIKIVLRISKTDDTAENKSKRRHYEISIDSPIHLLSVCFLVDQLMIVSFSSEYVSSCVYSSDINTVVWRRLDGLPMFTNDSGTDDDGVTDS
jgi:hypothetical protein